jgi:hypothetical protein
MLNLKQLTEGWMSQVLKNIDFRFAWLKAYDKTITKIQNLTTEELQILSPAPGEYLVNSALFIEAFMEPIENEFLNDQIKEYEDASYHKSRRQGLRYYIRQTLVLTQCSFENDLIPEFLTVHDLSERIDDELRESAFKAGVSWCTDTLKNETKKLYKPDPSKEVSQYYPRRG